MLIKTPAPKRDTDDSHSHTHIRIQRALERKIRCNTFKKHTSGSTRDTDLQSSKGSALLQRSLRRFCG